jgi:hypothetical protein
MDVFNKGGITNVLLLLFHDHYKEETKMAFSLIRKFISIMAKNLKLTANVNRLEKQQEYQPLGWPPGHYYSPTPSIAEIKEREASIFGSIKKTVPGIDLNEEGQLNLLEQLKKYYPSQPFSDNKKLELRYFFNNPNYSYGEAIILYCMMNFLRPGRIIEIGSGYSSCVILDTNELFFNNGVKCIFIEPYPELFLSLLKPNDRERVSIMQKRVQDIESNIFSELTRGDILFIDSSHVSKIDSDVNHIFFRILPLLASGVHIHFHDIGFPFEYPKEWIYGGRAWNEAYLLRAFLQYNKFFRIAFFNEFMALYYPEKLKEYLPISMKNPGTSIWLERQ